MMLPRVARGSSRGVNRLLSTKSVTTVIEEAAPYPFSNKYLAREPQKIEDHQALLKGKGLMEHIHKTLPTPEKRKMLSTMFSHNHPDRVRAGSVLRVTMEHAPTQFSGVLLAVRHRGIDTSFLLRNVIQQTGVEMQFFVNSPHLKDIKVIRDHSGKRGGRSVRRAKLFYLRDSPEKMTAFASSVQE